MTKEIARKVASREKYRSLKANYKKRQQLCDKAGGLWKDGTTRYGGSCSSAQNDVKKREEEKKRVQLRQRVLKEKEKRMIDCKFTTEAGCIGSKMARQHCVFDNKVASSKCKPRATAIAGDLSLIHI